MTTSPFVKKIQEKKIKSKPKISFSLEAVKPFHSQYKKPIRKSTKTLLQQSEIIDDTDVTDNFDPV